MSVNTKNTPLPNLQRIYNTQQTILGDMKDNDILLPGMSADDFRKINKAIGELNLEEDQPDPVGDAPSATSQFSSVDGALNEISQDRSIDAKATLDTYGVTARDALDRARSLATYEDTLGVAVSTIGKAFGPTAATVLEALREDPRQSYREMIAPLAALDYYSKEPTYDLAQPTSAGKGTRASPSKNTFFGYEIDTKPVGNIPMSQRDQARSDATPDTGPVSSMTPSQQVGTMSRSKRSGIGESYGKKGAEQTSAEAEAAATASNTASVGVGTAAAAAAARGARSSTDYGFGEGGNEGPAGGTGSSGSGKGGTGESGSMGGDTGAGPDSEGSESGAEGPGGWNTGGRIGALIQHLQTGGDVENADTNMEVANVPMGVVDDADGAPSPFSGGTGVEDDLDMDVEAGSYVLNAESVQLIGISDINAVIRDAYSIAAALGKEVPADYDPQNKVPIRISNGEAIIPKALVEIIGLDKLEKWNQKGLQLRKQKEEFMAEQQKQQPPQQQQVASEAPMQQQMQQLMSNGTLVKTVQQLEKEEARDFFRQEAEKQEEAGTQVPIEDVREWIKEQAEQVEEPTAANLQGMFRSGPPINQGITVEEIPDEPIESIPVPSEKQEAPLNKYNTLYGHGKYRYLLPKGKEITDMTISEIYNLQDSLRKETQDKSLTTTAVGGPQFLQKTIKDLLSRNKNITEDTLFTPDVQNQLTKQIFKEEKVYAFIENPIKKGQNLSAVQYNLAGRFASLPLKNNKSYHEGQKPAMTSDEFRKLLLQIQKLGTEKGIPLLIESIINGETSLRK